MLSWTRINLHRFIRLTGRRRRYGARWSIQVRKQFWALLQSKLSTHAKRCQGSPISHNQRRKPAYGDRLGIRAALYSSCPREESVTWRILRTIVFWRKCWSTALLYWYIMSTAVIKPLTTNSTPTPTKYMSISSFLQDRGEHSMQPPLFRKT